MASFALRSTPAILPVLLVAVGLGTSCNDSATNTVSATPSAEFSTRVLTFGMVAAGQTASRQFTLTNTGGGRLVGSFHHGDCGEVPLYGPCWYAVGSTSYDLGSGGSKTFEVRFVPFKAEGLSCGIDAVECVFSSPHGNVRCVGTGFLPVPAAAEWARH